MRFTARCRRSLLPGRMILVPTGDGFRRRRWINTRRRWPSGSAWPTRICRDFPESGELHDGEPRVPWVVGGLTNLSLRKSNQSRNAGQVPERLPRFHFRQNFCTEKYSFKNLILRFRDRQENAVVYRYGARKQSCGVIVHDSHSGAISTDCRTGRFSADGVCIAGLRGDTCCFWRATRRGTDASVADKNLANACIHLAGRCLRV